MHEDIKWAEKQGDFGFALVEGACDLAHLLNFIQNGVEKTYLALVDGIPPTPSGRVEAPIGRDPKNRKRMAIVEPGKGREAVTEYRRVLQVDPGSPWARQAERALGLAYANGKGVSRNDGQAVRWLRRAANHGDVAAQFDLGQMVLEGRGGPRDDAVEAFMWLSLSLKGGEKKARQAVENLSRKMTTAALAEGTQRMKMWLAQHPQE